MKNDIRNLMDVLRTRIDYKEFDMTVAPAGADWPVLERLGRAMDEAWGVAEVVAAESSAPAESRSLLRRYSPAQAAEAARGQPDVDRRRRTPLAEVFAALETAAPERGVRAAA